MIIIKTSTDSHKTMKVIANALLNNKLAACVNMIPRMRSKYVMDGINSWIANWKKNNWKTASKKDVKNKDLWIELDAETCKHEIEWIWVKGHSGNIGNEKADALANMGIDNLDV